MSQSAALAATVEVLALRPEYAVLVAYCEGLAEQLDAEPDKAALWREYRPALELLLEVGEASDDGEGAFLELLSTPLRDAAETG